MRDPQENFAFETVGSRKNNCVASEIGDEAVGRARATRRRRISTNAVASMVHPM